MYTKEEILAALDNNLLHNQFLNLQDQCFTTSGNRINLFADEINWAVVFEKSGVSGLFGLPVRATCIELTYFGNCLSNLDQIPYNGVLQPSNQKTFIISDFENIANGKRLVSDGAQTVKVRNVELAIEHDPKKYEQKGIEIEKYNNPNNLIDFKALIRFLDEENPELFRATEEELKTCLPENLPLLLKIDHWFHNQYDRYSGSPPSENLTFQMIADLLVTKQIHNWNPREKFNNNWRNWPNAGRNG